MAEPMPPPTFMSPPALELPNQAPMESVTYAPTAIPAEPSAPVVSAPSVPPRIRSVEELQKAIADDPTDSVARTINWLACSRAAGLWIKHWKCTKTPLGLIL